jgi:hypothetical protein
MTLPPIVTGIDRFIAQRWADYALDLLITADPAVDRYAQLKTWLDGEIAGKESSMKTASQIRRLWLDPNGKTQLLRSRAIQSGIVEDLAGRNVLHLGMAINVFPLFREVCGVVGRLTGLQGVCTSQETCQRVMEKYGNPKSVPHMVWRVFKTLVDWQLMEKTGKTYKTRLIEVENSTLGGWFLEALLFSQSDQQLALSDLQTLPERLGIQVQGERDIIRENPNLSVIRDGTAVERVALVIR